MRFFVLAIALLPSFVFADSLNIHDLAEKDYQSTIEYNGEKWGSEVGSTKVFTAYIRPASKDSFVGTVSGTKKTYPWWVQFIAKSKKTKPYKFTHRYLVDCDNKTSVGYGEWISNDIDGNVISTNSNAFITQHAVFPKSLDDIIVTAICSAIYYSTSNQSQLPKDKQIMMPWEKE